MKSNMYNKILKSFELTELEELQKKLESRETTLAEYVNKLFEQEERWIMVNHVIHNLNEMMDIKELTQFVCKKIQKITNVNFCSIRIFNFEKEKFEDIVTAADDSYNIVALKTSEKLKSVSDYILNYNSRKNSNFYRKIESIIQVADSNNYVFPIIIPEYFIAAVCIYSKIPLYTNSNTNVIEIICDNYKQAIERINLYKKLEKTSRHKTEFIANVTHEFKTPLNAIIGFAQLLKIQDFPKEKTNHFIDNIITNSQHMLHLIENVLDVSKVELNHLDLIYEKCSSKELIEEVVSILGSMYLAKNIKLNLILADIDIEIDKMRFKQIIYNLLNNAIKFTDENGQITLLTYLNKKNFYFEITDTGVGINDNDKEKIFDMFTQSQEDVLKKVQGHGLGLFICKSLVKLHGGEISFSNNKPVGCTFKFYIPAEKSLSI